MKRQKILNTDYDNSKIVKQYSSYPIIHRVVGKPQFLKFIGDVSQKHILDFGCGSGHITFELERRGAHCIGVDPSSLFIAQAKKNYLNLDFRKIERSKLNGLGSNQFDKVVLSMVLPAIGNKQEFKTLFREIGRVLKTNGELVLSTTHPLMLQNLKDSFRRVIRPATMNYFSTGAKFQTKVMLQDKTFITFTDSQWTLEDISNELIANNFVIVAIKEPKPSKNKYWHLLKNVLNTPYYIFIKAKKMNARTGRNTT